MPSFHQLDYAVDGRSICSTTDVPLVFAETGMEVLPRVDEPGRINPSREDGEGVSLCIRICDEGLIGGMGPYGGDGYVQLPTHAPTRQEFAETASMVELPDYDESGTDTIEGLWGSDYIAPRQDLQDVCREPTTPQNTHSDGKLGSYNTVGYQRSVSIAECGGHVDDCAHRLRQQRRTHLQCDVVARCQLHSVAGALPEDNKVSVHSIDAFIGEDGCPS